MTSPHWSWIYLPSMRQSVTTTKGADRPSIAHLVRFIELAPFFTNWNARHPEKSWPEALRLCDESRHQQELCITLLGHPCALWIEGAMNFWIMIFAGLKVIEFLKTVRNWLTRTPAKNVSSFEEMSLCQDETWLQTLGRLVIMLDVTHVYASDVITCVHNSHHIYSWNDLK